MSGGKRGKKRGGGGGGGSRSEYFTINRALPIFLSCDNNCCSNNLRTNKISIKLDLEDDQITGQQNRNLNVFMTKIKAR